VTIENRASATPLRSRPAAPAGYRDPDALNDTHSPPAGSADLALLRSALALAARGWHVFACAAGRKRPALRQSWQDLATADPDQVRDWWSRQPYNIGISCGPSGLVVIDLDVPRGTRPDGISQDEAAAGGTGTFARLCQRHGEPYPPATFGVNTPSGGCHLYFAAARGLLRNSAGLLGPLIDVRADGGYVVAPGSRIGQRAYTVRDSSPPMPLPPWIAALLQDGAATTPASARRLPVLGRGLGTAYALAALREETRRVATAQPGTRNDTLNRAGFSLGQLVAAGLLPPAAVITALGSAAARAGLPEGEARRTIRSGMAAGARKPRGSGGAS
jgi:Bifunctional DNA primase/polymerase, N-terminal